MQDTYDEGSISLEWYDEMNDSMSQHPSAGLGLAYLFIHDILDVCNSIGVNAKNEWKWYYYLKRQRFFSFGNTVFIWYCDYPRDSHNMQ